MTPVDFGPGMQKKPIFFDPTGRRAIRVSRLALAAGVISTLFVLICGISLFIGPSLASLHLDTQPNTRHALVGIKVAAPQLLKAAEKLATEVRARQKLLHR
ncbi:MAG: hypothetical protein ACTS5I_10670, partial [Rhodanobacter sp.]